MLGVINERHLNFLYPSVQYRQNICSSYAKEILKSVIKSKCDKKKSTIHKMREEYDVVVTPILPSPII